MNTDIQNALSIIRTTSNNDPAYLAACETLVANRDQLSQRVFIGLPGGLCGNDDPAWENVKASSIERCSCGNERVIMPSNLRTDFKGGETTIEIEVQGEKRVYLRPVGGDKPSTYVEVWIEGSNLLYVMDPFAPLVSTIDLFSRRGYKLEVIEKELPNQSTPPVFIKKYKGQDIPVFAFTAVSTEEKRITILLDEAVEVFDPNQAEENEHAC